MFYVLQVMKMFNVGEDLGREIIDNMYLDFSECSQEEFDREAKFAFNKIMEQNHFFG